jgi:hypothetical protein
VNNVSEVDEANSIRFAIYKVIMGVANQVETPEKARKIQEGVEKLLDANFRGEMEIVLQNLFESVSAFFGFLRISRAFLPVLSFLIWRLEFVSSNTQAPLA